MQIQMPLCSGSAHRLEAEHHHITKTKPNWLNVLLRGDSSCSAEPSLTLTALWHHTSSVYAYKHSLCTHLWSHTFGHTQAKIDRHKSTHTVCSHYCTPEAAERAVCPGCRTWGNMSDMATCLQAWRVTLLNCCNFLLLDWSCTCVTFHISPWHCP